MPFRKISTPENQVKLRGVLQYLQCTEQNNYSHYCLSTHKKNTRAYLPNEKDWGNSNRTLPYILFPVGQV